MNKKTTRSQEDGEAAASSLESGLKSMNSWAGGGMCAGINRLRWCVMSAGGITAG